MSKRVIIATSLNLVLWLFMATTDLAQSENEPVIDTKGNPVESGKEYYIQTPLTDIGGRFTLINRNGSCPLYVGQENTDLTKGLPVIFSPFETKDKVVKVERDFKVKFSASSTCAQSTEWKVGDRDRKNGRRFIITGTDRYNYFRIVKTQVRGIYYIEFCPSVCDTCRFECGTLGTFNEKLKIFLTLDNNNLLGINNKLRVQFLRA
ncbi:kunitz type trypsin inhibitor 106-like [Vicia villosa]|uniref:kunitz type trypsin inhibitor 106-like n=1 Tax=Vicia villosa TaxID=3911 RepID=UPI00273BC18A|nr:kunitz type trypsin inhibitor 106-like [Vicia villosa]